MNRHGMISIYFFVTFFLYASSGMAAQSSADIAVTPEFLNAARLKVMGGKSKNLFKDKEYVIGYGDTLYISIYGEGIMSPMAGAGRGDDDEKVKMTNIEHQGIKVRIDGRVSLSHIGDVEAVGMTLNQLADYLKELFSKVFDDPIVSTVLLNSASRRYTVMGNVTNPGIYLIEYPITLVQTIARC